jgi:hypothetical protein
MSGVGFYSDSNSYFINIILKDAARESQWQFHGVIETCRCVFSNYYVWYRILLSEMAEHFSPHSAERL